MLILRGYFFLSCLSDLIKSRRDAILKNLQDADNKLREAEENLAFAKKNFDLAKTKAEQIKAQGIAISLQTSKTLLQIVDEDIKRLKATNLSTIKFEEEKSINEVVYQDLYFPIIIEKLKGFLLYPFLFFIFIM